MLLIFMTIGASYMAFDYFKPINYTADKWVIFDFDGTIADTLPVMMMVVNELQPAYGYKSVRQEEIEALRTMTAKELIEQRLGLSWWQLPLLQYRFRKAVQKHLPAIQLNAGMEDVLHSLKDSGYKVGVISSNSTQFITNFFKKHKLPLFDDISEASIFGKAAVIGRFVKRNGIRKQNAVYIGDETRDIEASRKAKIPCIAVGWGGNSAALLLEYQPNVLVHDAGHLMSAIQQYVIQ
ncbi:HAD-IA family hydrolase [Candidatus Dependentiae bacterium]|nr:HAD-IA family hydrolase [Candidatus Dependentiae bacterium]